MKLLKDGVRLIFCFGLAGVFLSGDPTQSGYGESKKVAGTGEQIAQLALSDIFLGGDPNISVEFSSYLWSYRSRDPAWDKAQVFSVTFAEPGTEQQNQLHGHMAIAHPGGDLTFLAFEGTLMTLSPSEWAWELTGHFVRGTGRFAGITGRWRERSEWKMSGITSEWEAEYDVK